MVHILLLILKIIGITLLILLGILLLAVLCVLFVPIRYRIYAAKEEAADAYSAKAEISWLLHILSLRLRYEKKIICKVRLFGIVIYDFAKREEYANRKAEKEKKRAGKEAKKEAKEEAKKEKKKKAAQEAGGETKEEFRQNAVVKEDAKQSIADVRQPAPDETKQEEKQGFFDKVKAFFSMLYEKLKNILYTIRKICDKIKQVIADIAYYKVVLEKEESKEAFLCCKKQLTAIWKNICPKKLSIRLAIGFDDPATTGQFVSFYSMFYPWIYHTITLEPDFEQSLFQGTFFCKGRVTIFVLLKAAWIVYFDKNIRTFLRLWKKED